MSQRHLNMDDITVEILCSILSGAEEQYLAVAKLRHTTEAERTLLMQRAAVCQMAYLQLEGITPPPDDWSPTGRLPQELLDDMLVGPFTPTQEEE